MLLSLLASTSGSLYSPHPYPSQPPFFEGWYTRIIAESKSFGVIFGHVFAGSAGDSGKGPLPTTYVALLRAANVGEPMEVHNCYPNGRNVTIGGQPVNSPPDVQGPPAFEWRSSAGAFIVTAEETSIDITCDGVRFVAELDGATPWSAGGYGPGGRLSQLPLPLHWFVYSLRSRVRRYVWSSTAGVSDEGVDAWAHQEKNHGKAFPSSWTWSQALDTTSGAALALSGGPLFEGLPPAYLVGYRHPAGSGIAIDFAPANGKLSAEVNGCDGSLRIVGTHPLTGHRLEANVTARPSELRRCLLGPTATGFAPVCVESYAANASVAVYQWGRRLVSSEITSAALEFGGDYICKQRNPGHAPSPTVPTQPMGNATAAAAIATAAT